MRYMNDINVFVDYMYAIFPKLDILIHNAAQTIRRPREFYDHLIENELKLTNDSVKLLTHSTELEQSFCQSTSSQIILQDKMQTHLEKVFSPLTSGDRSLFPVGQLDSNSEQVDLRTENTWVKKLGTIDLKEVAELMSINAMAPFHMNQCFKTLLEKADGAYIVNVSSMEGVFGMRHKSKNHPHTNMAKSALNMMTRTSASDYFKYKIYMVSVDTGWVTNEFPHGYE